MYKAWRQASLLRTQNSSCHKPEVDEYKSIKDMFSLKKNTKTSRGYNYLPQTLTRNTWDLICTTAFLGSLQSQTDYIHNSQSQSGFIVFLPFIYIYIYIYIYINKEEIILLFSWLCPVKCSYVLNISTGFIFSFGLKLPSFEWGQGSLPRGTERE